MAEEKKTIPLTPQEYCNMRDSVYQHMVEIGIQNGLSEVTMNVRDTLSSGDHLEWDMKVVFRKDAVGGQKK